MEKKSALYYAVGMFDCFGCPTIRVIHNINARNGNLAPNEIEPEVANDAIGTVLGLQTMNDALRTTVKLEKVMFPGTFGK